MSRTLPILLPLALSACAPVPPAADVPLLDRSAKVWLQKEEGADALYRSGHVDLDGDGIDEMLVYVGGPGRCGSGGCSLYVLRNTADGIAAIARTSVTQLPIGVLDTRRHGMRDIVVSVGGGGMPFGHRVLFFDGRTYPANPTVPPAEPINTIGTPVIAQGDLRPIGS
ncbi:hypothetical protein [Alteriqipengyuania sp. 357]